MPFLAVVELADIAAGIGGFNIQGEHGHDLAGYSVASAGDINGDGIDNLIVGAYAGVYILFGKTDGFASPVDLGIVGSGAGGFKIDAEGTLAPVLGDVDGD